MTNRISKKYRKGKHLRAGWPYTKKPCRECDEIKELSEYPNDLRVQDGKEAVCRACMLEKGQAKAGNKFKKRQAIKRKAVEYMGDKCFDCQTSYPDHVYDFHHVKEKTSNLSELIGVGIWEKIECELKQCVMLCSNCHRMRHPPGPGKVEEGRGKIIAEGHARRRATVKSKRSTYVGKENWKPRGPKPGEGFIPWNKGIKWSKTKKQIDQSTFDSLFTEKKDLTFR